MIILMEKIIDKLNTSDDPFEIAKNLTVEELEKVILYSSDKYYNDEEVMPDAIWDMLVDFLRFKNKNNKVLKQIGSKVKSKNKVKLPYHLGSMDKIKPPSNKLDTWKTKHKGAYVLSEKLDGVSALLVYNDNMMKLYTRGTAKEGTDITPLLKYLSNIPTYETVLDYCNKKKLKGNKNLIAFRGELIISKKVFDKKWSDKLKNARNGVAGLVNSKTVNPRLAADTRFVCYEVVDPRKKILDQYKIMTDLEFNTVHNKTVKNINFDFLSKYLVKRKKESRYIIDGIIVTNNELYQHNKSGNPDYAFAFKDVLEDQKAITTVKDIEWKVSKDGYIVPTVIIDSVDIGGVTISRVTGDNAKNIMDNMISPGAKIEIVRSGDVIPKIEKVLTKAKTLKWPSIDYDWTESGVDIIVRDKNNKDIKIRNLHFFFSTLDTKGLGEKNIVKLYNAGIDTIEKILTVTKEQLLQVDGYKEKSSQNLLDSIMKLRESQSLDIIMKASNKLGRGMGLERAKSVLDKYPNLLSIYKKWSNKDFIDNLKIIDGWEAKTSKTFVDNFPEFIKFYNMLKKYINITLPIEKKSKSNGKYKDMTIVMSGFRDKELTEYLENEGAKLTNSISKNTDLLIVKDNSVMDTSKVKKAKELGIKIITKDSLIKI